MSTAVVSPGADPNGDNQDELRAPAAPAVRPFTSRHHSDASRATQYQVEGSLALRPSEPARDPIRGSVPSHPPETVLRSAVMAARALLEVLSGRRPASQLARWTSYSLQQDLERRAPRRPISAPLRLQRVRVREQGPGLAEICALAEDTSRKRVRVVAFRLERRGDEWIVTRLQFG